MSFTLLGVCSIRGFFCPIIPLFSMIVAGDVVSFTVSSCSVWSHGMFLSGQETLLDSDPSGGERGLLGVMHIVRSWLVATLIFTLLFHVQLCTTDVK